MFSKLVNYENAKGSLCRNDAYAGDFEYFVLKKAHKYAISLEVKFQVSWNSACVEWSYNTIVFTVTKEGIGGCRWEETVALNT